MKAHEVERKVRELGGVFHKNDSDHKIYRLPNGRLFLVPVGGKHSEARPYLIRKLERLAALP